MREKKLIKRKKQRKEKKREKKNWKIKKGEERKKIKILHSKPRAIDPLKLIQAMPTLNSTHSNLN